MILKRILIVSNYSKFHSTKKIIIPKNYRLDLYKRYSNSICNRVIPFKLADIGEGIREVVIKAWFVEVDQYVNQFDEVCQVESDKASVSITSRYDGIVKKIYYDVDDVALVGSTLLDIQVELENEIPISEVEHVDIKSRVSDAENDKRQCETQEHKRKFEECDTGKTKVKNLNEITLKNGKGKILADVTNIDDENFRTTIGINEKQVDSGWNKSLATPAVRRLAMENNVDINKIKGTGKNCRVLKEDILLYLTKPDKSLPKGAETQENKNKFQLTGYRKVMVKTMTESNKIPTLVLSDEYEITKLNSLKNELKTITPLKITVLPFFIKAISLSLLEYPILNSTLDKNCDHVLYNNSHNIGIAIDTPMGLVVPNIKSVQNLNIKEIAGHLQRLQKSATEGTLSIQDVSNGSFTISNIGSIAGTTVSPLILPPQVAICAVGRFQSLPRFDEHGNLKNCFIGHISWAADHRIIDGGTIARFSNSVKKYIENPSFFIANI